MYDWLFALILMFGGITGLLLIGVPVVFSFIALNVLGAYLFLGGEAGVIQMVRNMRPAVSQYSLVPIGLFVLMGEIMLQTGMARRSIAAIDRLISRVPGRLSIVAILGGTTFATLSGSSVANAAVVGKTLIPEMARRGYHPVVSIGPVAAVGGIAVLIPPSALAVMLGSVGQISINDLLIAGLVPGMMMMFGFLAYVVIRCMLNPAIAPSYDVEQLSWQERVIPFLRDVVPLFVIFVAVVGSMLTGLATPTESAAVGVLASVLVAMAYRLLSLDGLLRSLTESLKFSGMILFIICSSGTFSQILSFSGATYQLAQLVTGNDMLSAGVIILGMLVLLLFLGCFMESASMIMLTLPIFIPILTVLEVDKVWFGVMMMITLEIGLCTPPFGMLLFVVQGVLKGRYSLPVIYKAVSPYLVIEILVLMLIFAMPWTITWLPALFAKG